MIFSPLPGTPVITQPFGVNAAKYKKYNLGGHNGIDFRCRVGTALYAPCEGYIHYGNEGDIGYGKYIKITSLPYNKEGIGREITFGHLSSYVGPLEGHYVAAGDIVAYSGNTGDSTGPHLHMTYKKIQNGKELDYNNGFHGAIDVSPYIQLWNLGNKLLPSPF